MSKKNTRNLKVHSQSGHNYKETPAILLKGQWLKELGFDSNTHISVECENGRLTIVPREPEKEVIRTLVTKGGITRVAEERVVYR